MVKRHLLYLYGYFWCFLFSCSAQEYLYPLAAIEHSDGGCMVYVMHQKSPTQTELLLWNSDTHETFRGLSSSFSPASFTLLPHKDGFSFIDEGRVRIKYFAKRSPRAIDLHEPLSNITVVHWIDDSTFYLSAQCGSRYGIFVVTVRGEIETILADDDYDYLYPCKMNNQLFYIRRSQSQEYSCMTMPFPALTTASEHKNDAQELDARMRELILGKEPCYSSSLPKKYEQQEICQCCAQAIFLSMNSETEGYYLECPRAVTADELAIPCVYRRLVYQENQWKNEALVSFLLPKSLIDPGQRESLYESILPFLPRHIQEKIYFSDYDSNTQSIALCAFDVKFGTRTQLIADEEKEYFGVCCAGKRLFYGGKVIENAQEKSFFIKEDGKLGIDLPEVHFN